MDNLFTYGVTLFFFFFFLKLFYEHDYNTFVLQYNKAMVRDLLIYLHMFRALCQFFDNECTLYVELGVSVNLL